MATTFLGTRRHLAFWIVAVICLSVRATVAQEVVSGAEQRSQASSSPSGQQFQFKWSATGGHDDNLLGDSSPDPRTHLGGTWETAEGVLTYTAAGRHASFSADTSLKGRYYTDYQELGGFGGGGVVRFTADLGRRATLTATQGASYDPYYQFRFPTAAPSEPTTALGVDALTKRDSRQIDGSVEIVDTIGTRSSVRMYYGYRHTQLGDTAEPFLWQLGGGSFSRKLKRYAGFRLGYGYGQTHDGLRTNSPLVRTQNLDVGMTYDRPLSAYRRTAMSFASGSTMVSDQTNSSFVLLLDANVARAIGQTWVANLRYHRGVSFLEGFEGPVYADTVQVRLGGTVAGRIAAGVTGGYANGQQGLAATSRDYTSYSGVADFRIVFSRKLSFTTQYGYSHYDFGAAARVPFGLTPALGRHTIRFGLSGSLR